MKSIHCEKEELFYKDGHTNRIFALFVYRLPLPYFFNSKAMLRPVITVADAIAVNNVTDTFISFVTKAWATPFADSGIRNAIRKLPNILAP